MTVAPTRPTHYLLPDAAPFVDPERGGDDPSRAKSTPLKNTRIRKVPSPFKLNLIGLRTATERPHTFDCRAVFALARSSPTRSACPRRSRRRCRG